MDTQLCQVQRKTSANAPDFRHRQPALDPFPFQRFIQDANTVSLPVLLGYMIGKFGECLAWSNADSDRDSSMLEDSLPDRVTIIVQVIRHTGEIQEHFGVLGISPPKKTKTLSTPVTSSL